jgi:hypothetical protein
VNLTPEQVAAHLAQRNPFATRSVRPGVLQFRFFDGKSLEGLMEQLRQNRWTGEIVGKHGTGKSTLVHSLIPLLTEAGREVRLFTMHRGETRLPVAGYDLKSWSANTQVIIDGYEQLGGWTRTLVNRVCRKEGCGLLITAHESTGLSTLYRTEANLANVQSLVREMQTNGKARVLDADVAHSFERQSGNVREVFFELYDVYERRRDLGDATDRAEDRYPVETQAAASDGPAEHPADMVCNAAAKPGGCSAGNAAPHTIPSDRRALEPPIPPDSIRPTPGGKKRAR